MRRIFLSIAALALMLVTADSAFAQRWGIGVGWGGGYWGAPGYSVSYGTRVGDGFVRVGYSSGGYYYGYPAYGYYSTPVYYTSPGYYYSTPTYYYSSPVYYSGYYSYPRWGW
jgi:hypothetical protein